MLRRLEQGSASQPMTGKREPQTSSDLHADATSTEVRIVRWCYRHADERLAEAETTLTVLTACC